MQIRFTISLIRRQEKGPLKKRPQIQTNSKKILKINRYQTIEPLNIVLLGSMPVTLCY